MMDSISNLLYMSMQWSLDVKDSSIAKSGKGVFLKGHVRPGTFLVCVLQVFLCIGCYSWNSLSSSAYCRCIFY